MPDEHLSDRMHRLERAAAEHDNELNEARAAALAAIRKALADYADRVLRARAAFELELGRL